MFQGGLGKLHKIEELDTNVPKMEMKPTTYRVCQSKVAKLK